MPYDILNYSFEWIYCRIAGCQSEEPNYVITYSRNASVDRLIFSDVKYYNVPEDAIGKEIYRIGTQPAGDGYTLYHVAFMKSEITGIVILAKSLSCTEYSEEKWSYGTRQGTMKDEIFELQESRI